ncbi:MAG: glycoside hydrolase family 15 protein [Pyrinomonadaceae bacterium]
MFRPILISTISLLGCTALFGQTTNHLAPGAPGMDSHWPSAAKNGFGTSNTLRSKVWFTLNNGVMTEVYYPTIDVPNVQSLQLIIVTPEGKVETESEDTTHSITVFDDPGSLSFRQENTARSGAYILVKDYVTDPKRNSLLLRVFFKSWVHESAAYKLYVYYDPSLNNSGMHDSAWSEGGALLASDSDKASALVTEPALAETTNGYFGINDGLTQLREAKSLRNVYTRAIDGNVVQVGRLSLPKFILSNGISVTIALGFGRNPVEARENARASLGKGFDAVRKEYEAGWHAYSTKLPAVDSKHQRQFNMAAMVLKALEDKTYRGAMIASPSIPWGGGPNANEPTISGYHAVWSRDLYHVGTAFLAMGDVASANRALDYLFKVQQRVDGSFPQNSWVDGRPIGGGLQMDQIAFPLILAYQLKRNDRQTWLKHIKPAADFIVGNGPATQQERWEEKGGYSPSTIAAEIAGLVCAADIAFVNADRGSAARYLKTADEWALKVDRWTVTTRFKSELDYYIRVTENDDPNDGAKIEINSGGGRYDEREIVDAGFLELVRLGIKPAKHPNIVNSLAVVDKLIKVQTRNGPGWYRYNHDAYGETDVGGNYDGRTGRGRLWSLLTGERGEYELARGNRLGARTHLNAMMDFANEGMMIPEQIWDRRETPSPEFRFGEGTGSATPLAWSMAQFIRLAINLQIGRNNETPAVVAARYAKRQGH